MAARFQPRRPQLEGLGPGTYQVKASSTAPMFSLGSRFDSDVRSKDHIRPKKKDGPGPGTYELQSSIRQVKQLKNPTFGKAARDWSDLPKDSPAPNQYKNIIKYTETAYSYSIPKAAPQETEDLNQNPGPGAYKINRELQGGLAKSILGGGDRQKKENDSLVPGPGAYDTKDKYHPPGFRIVPHTNTSLLQQNQPENGQEQADPVGPQRYNPVYPTHTEKTVKIGSGTRDDMKPSSFHAPAPTTYDLMGQFEKAKANPKFHMGIKVGGRGNKNFDMPGPGEYETDVAPLSNINVAHVVGTSLRGDLGVGKAHLFPGPGEYETRGAINGPAIGFGTEMKKNKLKKTFEPGPGSYEVAETIGHLPKYVLMANALEQMNAKSPTKNGNSQFLM